MGALYHRILPVKAELTSAVVGNALGRACGVFIRPDKFQLLYKTLGLKEKKSIG